jgi:hypothetical protein
MTQQATFSAFLVRTTIGTPLVPTKKILSIAISGEQQNSFKFKAYAGNVRFDPEPTRVNYPYAFTYQACLAYYVHRCMPTEPQVSPRLNPYFKSLIHSLIAAFAFLFLQIACLNHERYHGLSGGGIQKKPAYRYRGCIEFYLSYAFWTLLYNDRLGDDYGDGDTRDRYCDMDFVGFHRYVFADVLKVMILAEPQHAGCTEIADAVFQTAGILPGLREPEPAEQIERISEAFCNFYKKHINLSSTGTWWASCPTLGFYYTKTIKPI